MSRTKLGLRPLARQVQVALPLACFLVGFTLVGGSVGVVRTMKSVMAEAPIAEPTAPEADQRVVTGKVTFVDKESLSVDINGETVKIAVSGATKITRKGETVALGSIAVDEAVTCTVTGTDASPQAVEIKVVTE